LGEATGMPSWRDAGVYQLAAYSIHDEMVTAMLKIR
jgi:hypothetical protein